MAFCTDEKCEQIAALLEAILDDDGSVAVYILMSNEWDPRYPIYCGRGGSIVLQSRMSPWEIALRNLCNNVVHAFLHLETKILKRDWISALIPKQHNRDQMGWSILKLACFYRNLPAVRLLLAKGASPNGPPTNIPSLFDLLPLGPHQNIEYFRLFLSHGADIDRAMWLHQLVHFNHLEGLRLALQYRPNINLRNTKGTTPFLLAAKKADRFPAIFDILLQNGADPNITDVDGAAIHAIARHASLNTRFVDQLIQAKTDLNARNEYGNTALHVIGLTRRKASRRDCVEPFIRALLDQGVDINAKNNRGRTPLHNAVRYVNFPVVQALIRLGASVEATDDIGWTPWHYACLPKPDFAVDDCLMIMRSLCAAGANFLAHTRQERRTALHEAIVGASNYYDMSFAFPVVRGILEVVGNQLINVPDEQGLSPLHYAALVGCSELIHILLEFGADINAREQSGRTALHLACGRRLKLTSLTVPMRELIQSLNREGEWSTQVEPDSGNEVITQERRAVDGVVYVAYRDDDLQRSVATTALLSVPGANACALDADGNYPFFMACINDAPLEQILAMLHSAALQGLFG